ncbi:MAG: polyribonucleotide nucleotidyltransferase [Flavobacteriales bacterium]|nr:polyribonucleotide nucleotidyltransferase [Flavobacteriales bacterium]
MRPEGIKQSITLPDGREITIETGVLAKQAHGSVVVRMGDTMLLATAVSNYEQADVDFLPLTVDYREKFAAAGRVPGGFFKREGRPSDEEILIMRLVDRALRPLFPKDYHAETQVMIQLMSHDSEVQPDALAGLAAGAAIAVSDIPMEGPMSEVRVARIDDEFVINPSKEETEKADIDLMVGGTKDSIVMVEGEMKEVSEEEMADAIMFAHKTIINMCEAMDELAGKVGTTEKREYEPETEDEDLRKKVADFCYDKVYAIAKQALPKHDRSVGFGEIKDELKAQFSEEELEEKGALIGKYWKETEKKAVRDMVLNEGIRLDGRKTTEVRPIWTEIDYLPSAHGSALFTRGETQSLTTATLGTKLDENRIDNVTFQGSERFYLHYNFPPFSTGEARPIRGSSRREVGHGNLAQRALEPMIPADNPYTVRLVSEILESNGSSSMATVCAGTMALMDAGIKITRPVSGIAMGLITDQESAKYAVLSDILGDEDFLGDMDFKVTGTTEGITACQMDIKIKGLDAEILVKALHQAKDGRAHILNKMMETISEPRTELKPNAPKIVILEINKDYIGGVIGPGGKIIQGMQEETGTTITIEEVDNKGIVEILGIDQAGIDEAVSRIKSICWEPVVGEIYMGTVKAIQPYGAFVEIGPKTDGLLHISEIDWKRIDNVEDVLKEGDQVKVKLLEIDDRGKMRLSRKVLFPKPERNESYGGEQKAEQEG